MRRFVLGFVTAMAFACDSTGPDDPGGTLSYTIVSARPEVSPPPEYQPITTAAVEQGLAVVEGRFVGGLCGSELETRFDQNASTLRLHLWVRVRDRNPICLAEVVETEYRAVFDQVPGGVYAVEVITWYGRHGVVDTARAGSVQVP